MNKIKISIILLLAITILVLIGYHYSINKRQKLSNINNNQPIYQSQKTVTTVYHLDGKIHYKLIAKNVQNYAYDYIDNNSNSYVHNATINVTSQPVTWFSQPIMTLFNENAVGSWIIKSDKAKLTNNKMLYLYGHVEVSSSILNSQIKKIKTNNAQINLINQDISSNNQVTLYGINFFTNSMKIHGNLYSQVAELVGKVKTYYEIQK
ncbi:LPS export ABC transporter periplasmic protein LptC [Candidatus Fukatsuia anoeciicola]|uniref:LPS export ABC transporter periplasmic protein LptC n=1 Tax=Candidatus Fukatsuia anoeciicola TaxID=2994492 RepID=UPI003464B369